MTRFEKISELKNLMNLKYQSLISQIETSKEEMIKNIEDYKKSDEYEEDLDELLRNIKSLHYKDKGFNHVHDRNERISLKEAQLKKKSIIFVGEGAVGAAMSVAVTLPEPITIIGAAKIGALTSATIVSSSALKIIYKRSLNGFEAKSFSPA